MAVVEFKPVTQSDIEQLRLWRNMPRIQNNMINTSNISITDQQQWFEKLQTDNSQQQFVCWLDGKSIGVLNFTAIEEHQCEWGCYVGSENILPGFGLILAACALDYAFNILNVQELNAQVLMNNKSPQKIHTFFKYENLGNTLLNNDENTIELIHYKYTKDAWYNNKKSIFSLLPKHLMAVIESAKFSKDNE